MLLNYATCSYPKISCVWNPDCRFFANIRKWHSLFLLQISWLWRSRQALQLCQSTFLTNQNIFGVILPANLQNDCFWGRFLRCRNFHHISQKIACNFLDIEPMKICLWAFLLAITSSFQRCYFYYERGSNNKKVMLIICLKNASHCNIYDTCVFFFCFCYIYIYIYIYSGVHCDYIPLDAIKFQNSLGSYRNIFKVSPVGKTFKMLISLNTQWSCWNFLSTNILPPLITDCL